MSQTVIQNVLSGGMKQPTKKDVSSESGKTDFQDLLEAATDKMPPEKPNTSESDKAQESQNPDVDAKEPDAKEPDAKEPDAKVPDVVQQMMLLFGMPHILQAPDPSTAEMPVTTTTPAAVDMVDASAATAVQQEGENTVATQDGKVKDHPFTMQDKSANETVPETAGKTANAPENETIKAISGNQNLAESVEMKTMEDPSLELTKSSETTEHSVGDNAESKKETVLPEVIASTAHVQKDQGIQQSRANEGLPHVPVNEAEPQKMTKDISDVIAKSVQSGKREFEIQLEPLHLGKLAIKVTYEDGKAAVSILCSSTKTLEALAQNAKDIGAILDYRLGTDTQIIVEHPETDYLNQQNQQKEQDQGSQKEQEQSQKEQNAYSKDGVNQADFLQQLRLGLV